VVATVLLNWNGWRDTQVCLESLAKIQYTDHRVIVVDNGSTDDSVARLQAFRPAPLLLQTGANLGFCGGNNVGIRRALQDGAEYVWLLNNDARIEDPDILRKMVACAEADPRIGAVGAVLMRMDAPGEIQAWGGGRLNLWLGWGREQRRRVPAERLHYLTGASILIPRRVWERVGLLDEGFFLYWDDADLGVRLRQAGWKLAVAEDCRVLHRSFSTTPEGPRLAARYNRSAVRMFSKHAPAPWMPLLIGTSARLAKRALLGRWNQWPAILRSVSASWRETAGLRRSRRRVPRSSPEPTAWE
jgi:GT2 family glycosyltransferase